MNLLGNGLARAAVRFKPASFAGTFVALCTAAMIISACGFLAETGVRASVPAHRYGDAPVVVTANQQMRLDKDDASGERVPETARFDTAWARKAAAAPGVAAAVPDVDFTLRSGGPGNPPLTGHGWGATAFTGERLSAGSAPRDARQTVLDAGTARALHAGPGDRVTLTTPAGDRAFRVSGIAEAPEPTAWFTDAQAQALAGHPGRAEALAVLPAKGTGTPALEAAVGKALQGTGARVHTGDARGGVEDPGVAYAKETLMALGFSFGAIAAMTAVFTAAGTVSLSIGQRARDFALLRAVGATPRQIRRSVATEAMLVAPLAAALGCLPGMALADWWFGELRERDAVPQEVPMRFSALPVWAALGTVVGTALLAGFMAARRPARIRPGQALSEAATERFRPGIIRTLLGLGALAGGVVLARMAAAEGGEDAANLALAVVMTLMTAVALLSQYVAKAGAWLLGLPLRAGSAASSLAAANSWANARRLASAITPVALALAFCSTLIFLHTSEDRQVSIQQRDGLVADHVVTSDTGLPVTAAERAARTPGVAHAVGLLRTKVLVPVGSGAEHRLQSSDAQGIGGSGAELAAVQDLGVREGSLASLRAGTVAIDGLLARSAGVGQGERLELRLPDGTRHAARVVAVYQRGAGLSPLTLPRQTLEGHVDSAYDSEVLVRDTRDADPAAVGGALAKLGEVAGKDGWTKAQDTERAVNAWGNKTMALVLGGFAAVAAGNTLVMTVLDRHRELRTLRLVGSTRRQVLRMVRWEALMVAAAGVALGSSIATVTLVPMIQGLFDVNPYAPPLLCAAFVGGAVALSVTFSVLPARAALRAAR